MASEGLRVWGLTRDGEVVWAEGRDADDALSLALVAFGEGVELTGETRPWEASVFPCARRLSACHIDDTSSR